MLHAAQTPLPAPVAKEIRPDTQARDTYRLRLAGLHLQLLDALLLLPVGQLSCCCCLCCCQVILLLRELEVQPCQPIRACCCLIIFYISAVIRGDAKQLCTAAACSCVGAILRQERRWCRCGHRSARQQEHGRQRHTKTVITPLPPHTQHVELLAATSCGYHVY
jgi:hypothetical protein